MSSKRYVRSTDGDWALCDGADRLVLDGAPWAGGKPTGTPLPSGELGVPVAPTKIVGIGKNYRAHAKEMQSEVPKEPLLFFKPPSSLLASGRRVVLPPESERVDYEGELGVVIGQRCRRISPDEAMDHVFGYVVVCDVTARDLQKSDGQWTRAKGFDTFCPVGAEVVTGVDPSALGIRVTVNGDLRQDGNTRDMVNDIPALISHISQAMTLEPGDLLATGTPNGVGPLADGDRVDVDVEQVGTLDFSVVTESR